MKWGAPHLAGLLWLFPIVVLLYIWSGRLAEDALKKFAQPELLGEISAGVAPKRKRTKMLLVSVALLLMVIAFIRPQWGFTWQEVKREGLDILIALDTSNSMLAEDVLPNRLQRSKLAIRDLVRKLRGDRVGLVAFSGTAFLQCPLTLDYNGFLLSLDDISVDIIPVGGTSISNAIYTAIDSYEGGKKKNKVLIIITDGEDLEGGVERAVARAKAAGVTIYCVGIGTAEGEIIPIRDAKGKIDFIKDDEGNVVRTRLNEDVLQEVALGTGGTYVRSTATEFGLDLIYDQKLSKLEKEEFKSRMEKDYKEKFQLPLALAILLLFVEPFIIERRNGRKAPVA